MNGILLLLAVLPAAVLGHGRLTYPASRVTMWRYGFDNPPHYTDHELNCGSFQNQFEHQGGKCGVCGDPYQGPRQSEAGGLYANGVIAAEWRSGQVVDIEVELTANHQGFYQFSLCPVNDPSVKATEECFNKHIVQLADGTGSKYYIGSYRGKHKVTVRLPAGLKCEQCVFRWWWLCGNRWGCDDAGECCVGCGPVQESFYGCADVKIV